MGSNVGVKQSTTDGAEPVAEPSGRFNHFDSHRPKFGEATIVCGDLGDFPILWLQIQ
jgi:hypothetical protein